MALSEFSLKNRYTIYALFIAAVVFGIMSYFTLPIQLFPDTAPPLVNILTPYPGAIAEDVADLVSEPIEREMAALEGVYRIASKSQNGLSLVEVEFRYDISVDMAAIDVQNAVAKIRGTLPQNIGEPQILKFSTANRPILTLGLRQENLSELRQLTEDVLSAEIQRVEGVAIVDVFGGHQAELSVKVNRDKLESYRLPIQAIAEAIRVHNVSIPAGQIRSEGRQYSFRIDEESKTIQDIADIPIVTPAGDRIRIGNLAQVEEVSGENLSLFRVNGKTAIAMQVFKQDDANTVDTVKRVLQRFEELKMEYPDLEVIVASEDASFTQQVVSNMLGAVMQALLLATIIIFLFLGSIRRGFVVAVSMPLSFLLTFAGMKLLGIQLNMVTLTAVILAVGMVVDASVVVLENISRHYEEGNLSPFQAALEGAKEIQFAVIAGNATTITVLIPLLFLYGFIGKTFGPLAATMIIAFLSSLLVALSIVPILTMMVTKSGGRFESFAQKITRPWEKLMDLLKKLYLFVLQKSLKSKAIVFVIAFLLLIMGAVILRNQGMELLPKMDGGSFFVTIETHSGSSLEETEKTVTMAEAIILAESEVLSTSSQMGFEPGMRSFGGGGVQGPTQAFISVTLTPRTKRKESIWDIQDRLRENLQKIPNIQNMVVRESGSTAKATTTSSIVVNIQGEDPLVLDRLGYEVIERIKKVEGVVNPYRSWRLDQQITKISVDTDRTSEMKLSPALVAAAMNANLEGLIAGKYRGSSGISKNIRVRYDRDFRSFKEDAFSVSMISIGDGKVIPVRTFLDSEEKIVQGLVTRENRLPTLDILALHQNRSLNFVSKDVADAISSIPVPKGYSVAVAGEQKDMADSRKELIGALLISLLAVYLLLVTQFKSFIHPITVLMAVPLSLIGISLALWIAGKPVSMPVLVGLILLIGIVVNNSIIIIDFIKQKREAGWERQKAIIASVDTRFRPIMMTSLSTIAGMIPLAMEWSLGAERFSPLAIAVIGGMTASTFLTMIVIPVLYDAFDTDKSK